MSYVHTTFTCTFSFHETLQILTNAHLRSTDIQTWTNTMEKQDFHPFAFHIQATKHALFLGNEENIQNSTCTFLFFGENSNYNPTG